MPLVLTRKIDEAVVIGEVTIRVADIRGDKVRLAITAPRDVRVLREELIERLSTNVPDGRLGP